MSFLQSIMSKLGGGRSGRAPFIHLGAFGKHPGWNDHIDDMGLESPQLINAKRIFYVQGMSGNIDSGAWDHLAEDDLLKHFKHVFAWRVGDDLVVGRLWSSSDGKGRKRYPMIVCAHCVGLPLPWAFAHILPQLEKVEAECTAATTASTVRSIMDKAREELRSLIPGRDGQRDNADSSALPNPLATLAMRPEMGAELKGLLAILYQVERELAPFRPNQKSDRSVQIAPRHLRVPACAPTADEAMVLWLRFMLTQLDPNTPLCVIYPLEEQFIDLIVGEPTPTQLFCVRASARKIPLTTDIPYNLDAEFISRSKGMIASAH
ncbi:MAG TPA: hypothetical protein VGQ99_17010 [Tepidisphaeraceae bacterium]|nr:hypothetical protein [Tepidisphaeraceae bacterium]